MKRQLRWFERRVAKGQEDKSLSELLFMPDKSLALRLLYFAFSVLALGTVLVSGFALSIPSELRVFIDGYLLSNILLDSSIVAALALLTARLLLPLLLVGILLLGVGANSALIRNSSRIVVVYSSRNGFDDEIYPTATVLFAIILFLLFSFGPFEGLIYSSLYLIVLAACTLILILGEIFSQIIASKKGSLHRRVNRLEQAPNFQMTFLALVIALATISTFCLGYGVALKRQLELVVVEIDGTAVNAAVIGTTSQGMIIRLTVPRSETVGNFAFVPFIKEVYSSPSD